MVKNENINIEYEARAMISESQYHAILRDLPVNVNKTTNTNNYFDYEDLFLTNHHMVLRTRNINENKYELTLKIKGEDGDIEHNLLLDYKDYVSINENILIPNSEVKDKLLENNIELKRLKKITTLVTERIDFKLDKALIVIDKNSYNNKIDYNVEVESDSKESAIKYLDQYFAKYGVKYKKGYIFKSRRAIFKL